MADDKASWAGFATAALEALGKSAPWVVIGCIAAFGVYTLQRQSQENFTQLREIARSERELAAKDFQAANTTLQDTYASVKTLTDGMLASFEAQLTQLRALEEDVRERQKEVFDRRLEAEQTLITIADQRTDLERTRSELAQLETQLETRKAELDAAVAAQAQADLERTAALEAAQTLRAELSEEQARLETTRTTLERNRRQLAELGEQLDGRKQELDQAVARVREVLAVLREVAETTPDELSPELAALRDRARDVVPQVSGFLRDYASKPDSRDTLDPSAVIGASLSELRAAMRANDRIAWYLASDRRTIPNRPRPPLPGPAPAATAPSSETLVTIIGVDKEQVGTPSASDILHLSLDAAVSRDALNGYLNTPTDRSLDDRSIAAARLSQALSYACVDLRAFGDVSTCVIRETGSASVLHRAGREIAFSRILTGSRSTATPLFGAADPQVELMSAVSAVTAAAERDFSWRTYDRFAAYLVLTLAENRDALAALELRVGASESSDIPASVALQLADWMNAHFQTVFAEGADFSSPVALAEPDPELRELLASFLTEVAIEAVSKGTGPEMIVALRRAEDNLTLFLPEPINAFRVGIRSLTLNQDSETGAIRIVAGE